MKKELVKGNNKTNLYGNPLCWPRYPYQVLHLLHFVHGRKLKQSNEIQFTFNYCMKIRYFRINFRYFVISNVLIVALKNTCQKQHSNDAKDDFVRDHCKTNSLETSLGTTRQPLNFKLNDPLNSLRERTYTVNLWRFHGATWYGFRKAKYKNIFLFNL